MLTLCFRIQGCVHSWEWCSEIDFGTLGVLTVFARPSRRGRSFHIVYVRLSVSLFITVLQKQPGVLPMKACCPQSDMFEVKNERSALFETQHVRLRFVEGCNF